MWICKKCGNPIEIETYGAIKIDVILDKNGNRKEKVRKLTRESRKEILGTTGDFTVYYSCTNKKCHSFEVGDWTDSDLKCVLRIAYWKEDKHHD